MKSFFIIAVALLAASFFQTPASANPMIHRDGLQIVDGAGRPFKLRGVNLSGSYQWEGFMWGKGILTGYSELYRNLEKLLGTQGAENFRDRVYAEFFTEEDFAKISELGFNSVRILINRKLLMDDSGAFLDSGWKSLDRDLAFCAKYHLYAILDLHAAPGGQSMIDTSDPTGRKELVWNSEESRQRTVALWKAIARRYAGNMTVAGYDLLNEPVPPRGEDLVSLYSRIITAIRTEDKQHMLILEGGKMAMDFSMFRRPLDANQIYSFHMYTWFGDNRKRQLAGYADVAHAQHVPFWIGEFGENTYDMIGSTVDMYENADFIAGWNYFPWKRAPTHFPGLVTFEVPEHWAKVINWLTSTFAFKPKGDVAQKGVDEFFDAIKLKNCTIDERMAGILIRRAP